MTKHLRKSITILLAVIVAITFLAAPVSAAEQGTDLRNMFPEDFDAELIKKQLRAHRSDKEEQVRAAMMASPYMQEVVRIMVDLQAPAAKVTGATDRSVIGAQGDIRRQVLAITGTSIINEYGYLANGFSLNAKRCDIAKIKAIAGVKNVTEVERFEPTMFGAVKMTHAVQVWDELNYKGEGMLVSIVDTGIDYTHKDMRISDPTTVRYTEQEANVKIATEGLPGKYFTEKIPYGYNYADKNQDIVDHALSGHPELVDAVSMHGMHVAGITAANATDEDYAAGLGIRGVAPEAQLLAMKVFSNDQSGGAWSDDILVAIEDSVKMGADIVNLSLGSPNGFSELDNSLSRGIAAATDAGALLVMAAGNEGLSYDPQGGASNMTGLIGGLLGGEISGVDSGSVGAYSVHPDALSVASVNNQMVFTDVMQYTTDDGVTSTSFFFTKQEEPAGGRTFKDGEYIELVDIGFGFTEDVEGLDLTGKYALAQRGDTTFQEKAENAASVGAIGIFIRDNRPTTAHLGMSNVELSGISAAFLWNDVGEEIVAHLNAGETVKIDTASTQELVSISSLETPSIFTSWGPSPEFHFKPEVAGIGGSVYSTMNGDNYGVMSGTSMSTPHTAGAAALVMQAMAKNPRLAALTGRDRVMYMKKILSNTAHAMADEDAIHSPRRVGAGLINVEAAIKANVTVAHNGQGNINLKDLNGPKTVTLVFRNHGLDDVIYTPEETVVYTGNHSGDAYDYPIEDGAVTFGMDKILVPAGGEVAVDVTIDPGSVEHNYVEGYLVFVSDSEVTLSIPFLGYAGNWDNDFRIFDFVEGLGPNALGRGGYYDLVAPALGIENLGCVFSATQLYYDNPIVGAPTPAGNWLPWVFGEEMFDPWTVGFNSDPEQADNQYVIRELIPRVGNFRGLKGVETYITDAEGNELIQPGWYDEVRKPTQYRLNAKGRTVPLLYDTNWDGTLYDPTLGEFVYAPEGQYFYNVRGRMSQQGKWQSLSIPVKIDNTPPVTDLKDFSFVPYNVNEDLIITLPNATDGNGTGIDLEGSLVGYLSLAGGFDLYFPEYEFSWDGDDLLVNMGNPTEVTGDPEAIAIVLIADYAGNDIEYWLLPAPIGARVMVGKNPGVPTNMKPAVDNFITYNKEDIDAFAWPEGQVDVVMRGFAPVTSIAVNGAEPVELDKNGFAVFQMQGLEEAVPVDVEFKGYDKDKQEVVTEKGQVMYDITMPTMVMEEEILFNDDGIPYIKTTDAVHIKMTDNYDKGLHVFGFNGMWDEDEEDVRFVDIPADEDGHLVVPVGTGFEDESLPVLLVGSDFVGNYDFAQSLMFFVLPEGADPNDLPLEPVDDSSWIRVDTPGFENFFGEYIFYHIEDIASYEGEDIPVTLEGEFHNIGSLMIDGDPVALLSDGTWTHDIVIREGLTTFNVMYTSGTNGTQLHNTKVRVYADGTVPNLSFLTDPESFPTDAFIFPDEVTDEEIEALSGNEQPMVIWTNQEETDVRIEGKASDNTFGYKLKINGNVVIDYYDLEGEGPEVNERPFEWTVEGVKPYEFIRMTIEDLGDFESPDFLLQKIQILPDFVAPTIQVFYQEGADGEKVELLDAQQFDVESDIILSATALDDEDGSGMAGDVAIWVNGQLYNGEPLAAGIYGVVFRAKDKAGNETIVVRNILVHGDPVLEVGPAVELYPEDIETFDPMADVKATDPVEGDLTELVVCSVDLPEAYHSGVPGTYTLTYMVVNSVGRSASAERQVKILGRPVILGVKDQTIQAGASFDPMKGVEAYDNEDGDLTDEIIVEGHVHPNEPGTYKLTYHVYDSDGNKAEDSCVITVKAVEVPDTPDEPDKPTKPDEPIVVDPTEPDQPDIVPPTGEMNWMIYAGIILVAGAVVFVTVLLYTRRQSNRG